MNHVPSGFGESGRFRFGERVRHGKVSQGGMVNLFKLTYVQHIIAYLRIYNQKHSFNLDG